MEGKIIAVWGSPHSGKTTFATKLATAIYSSFESTVITLYTDLETPVIPVLFPFDKNEDLGSVGYPLSKTEVEQGDIINNLVTVKQRKQHLYVQYNDYLFCRFADPQHEIRKLQARFVQGIQRTCQLYRQGNLDDVGIRE